MPRRGAVLTAGSAAAILDRAWGRDNRHLKFRQREAFDWPGPALRQLAERMFEAVQLICHEVHKAAQSCREPLVAYAAGAGRSLRHIGPGRRPRKIEPGSWDQSGISKTA